MSESYFNLKKKLEELGYNGNLPLEAVPLVECILADLMQTTRSLQHYMNLSKDALIQRDKLASDFEPYKNDNTKLLQENNQLHKELMCLKERYEKQSKNNIRNVKSLSEELIKKDATISKLQHELRDLSLRGLCARTLSSRNKSRRKDSGDDNIQRSSCTCSENKVPNIENDLLELMKKNQELEETKNAYYDEILLLKSQVIHRDDEIIRLNILLDGGRPLNTNSSELNNVHSDNKVQEYIKQLNDLESTNEFLKKELDNVLEKQHEAMLRALKLANDNTRLKDELAKVDTLALKVEEDCNNKLSSMMNEQNTLKIKLEQLTKRNSQSEQLSQEQIKEVPLNFSIVKVQDSLNIALKEKNALEQEIKDLLVLNKSLQEKLISLSDDNNKKKKCSYEGNLHNTRYATRDDLQSLLETERKVYEKHLTNLQEKLTDTINLFDTHLLRCQNKDTAMSPSKVFIKDLHNKLCESEQKILMLKKQNDELNCKNNTCQDNSKENYKDIISQLNAENSELIKENLTLTKQLSQYKTNSTVTSHIHSDSLRKDFDKVRNELEQVKYENQMLGKDKQEYKQRYKESMDLIENLKRDLVLKQKQVEQLQEENCSFKMTNRTGRASAEHLKEECNYLREQLKLMQTDIIREKTLANQIKNIQIETERSSNEIQNELLTTQKRLSSSKNTLDTLERKCKNLQSEISSLKSDKSSLIENFKTIDKERDQLVIEIDHKTETICALENKLKSQINETEKLEKELLDLNRKLNLNKISEHKLVDYDAQIKFLNGEISRLTQQYDNAVIENKQLQNSLADVNGNFKVIKIEYDKSRKEVEDMKQQLQHYVVEVRRIEELLSQKDAERSDMLEHFASLSVEANLLENTNHSLESESATKTLKLQSYINKIQELESKVIDKNNIIDNQSARLAAVSCKISAAESEIKLMIEEKEVLEKNVSYLKQMCNNLHSEKSNIVKGIDNTDSELKLYENKIKSLSSTRTQLEAEKLEMKEKLLSTEKLFSNARKEIIELKLALQDATTETKMLQEQISRLKNRDSEYNEGSLTRELELPLMLEETIHEVSHEEDEESSRYHEIRKRFSKYTHSGTI